MTVVKISELPQKDALEDGDKVIAWNSANGATSVLLGTAFTAIKEASATSASAAKASETAAKNLASEASSSADSASESASGAALSAEAAKASETNALASANSASASQTQIESDIAQAKLDITTERTAAVSAVEVAQATAISSIQAQGTESVTAVTDAKATSVSAVKAQETASIQAIEADSVLAGYAKKDELSSAQSALSAQISAAIAQAVTDAKLAAHPVGSYYWSSESTDPSALFGGTWEQVKDRFVLAAGDSYAVGATGGTASSSHTHQYGMAIGGWWGCPTIYQGDSVKSTGALEGGTTATGWTNIGIGTVHRNNVLSAEQSEDKTTALFKSTANTSAATVDNMPPYVVAFCWKRTA